MNTQLPRYKPNILEGILVFMATAMGTPMQYVLRAVQSVQYIFENVLIDVQNGIHRIPIAFRSESNAHVLTFVS